MSIDINNTLERRGILAVAERAKWSPQAITVKGQQYTGWQYPVLNAAGQPYDAPRWKNANGNGPRYFWPQSKPEKAKYYFLPGLRSAITRNNGLLYIATGEPDVLAYHAAGIDNVFCWLAAEVSVPDTIVSDLTTLGVKTVVYVPDRDDAGMRGAANLYKALKDSAIGYTFLQLPGPMGSKQDVNDLWLEAGQSAAVFFSMLWGCDELDAIDLHLYSREQAAPDVAMSNIRAKAEQWRDDWYKLIMGSMGPGQEEAGITRWRCPLPHRHKGGDKNPSFRFSTDQNPDHPWPVCSCGIQLESDPWGILAGALNLPSWQEYRREQAQKEGYEQTKHGLNRAPDGSPATGPRVVSNKEVYRDLSRELRGEVEPEGVPIEFPYTTLHHLGGFARWLWTGKAVGIGGISGGGKTMLLKCLMTVLLSRSYDVIWWGPEWSPAEYGVQDLQRLGGLSFDQINALRVIRALERGGLSRQEAVQQSGLALPGQASIDTTLQYLDRLIAQPGTMHIIPDGEMHIDDLVETVKVLAADLRREGRKVAAFAFDYVQLANMPGNRGWQWGEQVVGKVKAAVSPSAANLTAFLTVQSRKQDAERVREDGERLRMSAAQGLDEKFFNLYMTLTPDYSMGQQLDSMLITVAKNSMGALGEVRLSVSWPRLMVHDKTAQLVQIPLNQESEIGEDG